MDLCRTTELQDQLSAVGERIRQADADLEESKGEKTQKYKDLRKRESDINGNFHSTLLLLAFLSQTFALHPPTFITHTRTLTHKHKKMTKNKNFLLL